MLCLQMHSQNAYQNSILFKLRRKDGRGEQMSNLEHLIENGLCRLDEGKSYREWREIMQEDVNWEGNENITLDNLWEICQYVIYTWQEER